MSRSFRHLPIHGHCAGSEKKDKSVANGTLRMKVKCLLNAEEFEVLPLLREVSNIRKFKKDGKGYILPEFVAETPKLIRK